MVTCIHLSHLHDLKQNIPMSFQTPMTPIQRIQDGMEKSICISICVVRLTVVLPRVPRMPIRTTQTRFQDEKIHYSYDININAPPIINRICGLIWRYYGGTAEVSLYLVYTKLLVVVCLN
jgi:hypothetical protein